jgi:hypothetical protein
MSLLQQPLWALLFDMLEQQPPSAYTDAALTATITATANAKHLLICSPLFGSSD